MTFNEIYEWIGSQIMTNQFAAAGVITSALIAIVHSLREIPIRLYLILRRYTLYKVTIEENDRLYKLFNDWLYENYKESFKNVEANLYVQGLRYPWQEKPEWLKTPDKLEFQQYEDTFILWYNKTPIFLHKYREKLEGGYSKEESHKGYFVMTTFLNKTTVNDLLTSIVNKHNKKRDEEFKLKVYMFKEENNEWEVYKRYKPLQFDKVIMNAKTKSLIKKDLDNWIASEEKLRLRGKTIKRGHLYYGKPGNGKTSITAAIGYEYKRHIYYMDINSFSNDEKMKRAFQSIQENSILLIEDIDQVFNGREPVRKDCQVTFSMFINMLSGVLDKDGILTIITTNRLEQLDEALLRAGRMDFHCEVLPPCKETINQYIKIFYDLDVEGEVVQLVERFPENFATLELWCESSINDHEKVLSHIRGETELELLKQ